VYGYTVIDPATVISTHLVEVVKQYAEDLMTRQDVSKLLDNLAKSYPLVVEEARKIPLGTIQQILKALLHEQIPIRDLLTILETTIDSIPIANGDFNYIVDRVRQALARVITDTFKDDDGVLKIITFSPDTEQYLLNKQNDGSGRLRQIVLTLGETNALLQGINQEVDRVRQALNVSPVLLIPQQLRRFLSEKLSQSDMRIVVLSPNEIDTNARFEVCGQIHIGFGGA
ncbi:MAG: FHIPEP family type III secretion protein, partial [Helicobacter sp.]|nr:FHIPEP family type III secretion protein [Helicobacter sp.]